MKKYMIDEVEDTLTLKSDELKRYKIQKHIEEWSKRYGGDFYFIQNEIYAKLQKRPYVFSALDVVIKEIGIEDLKFFFNIETTMTKRECIEKELSFEDEKGTQYLCREGGAYFIPGIGYLNISKPKEFLESENEIVKIIGDK